MGMPANSSLEKQPPQSGRDPGTPEPKPGPYAPPRGKLFQLLWPITSYVVTNVTVTLLWVVLFVLNRTRVIGRRNVGAERNTLLLSNHQSMLDSFLVGLAAFYPQSCLKPHLIPWNPGANESRWVLRGVASYERYVTRLEREALVARQEELGRPQATRAALIPIRKSAAWWDLTQDERRAIFEERSGHIRTGLRYLPAVARRLYHCRDLGEPFDFLTWFEYAPHDQGGFDELVGTLRTSEEWTFVEREVDIRLVRTGL
jgi:hypothetical protein